MYVEGRQAHRQVSTAYPGHVERSNGETCGNHPENKNLMESSIYLSDDVVGVRDYLACTASAARCQTFAGASPAQYCNRIPHVGPHFPLEGLEILSLSHPQCGLSMASGVPLGYEAQANRIATEVGSIKISGSAIGNPQ